MNTQAAASSRDAVGRVGQRRQIVIPRDICESLQLREGDFVAFTQEANGVLIKPARPVHADDVLIAGESALRRKAGEQMRRGHPVTLVELEHELDRKPRARSRKTT
jgi:AbrB family looped-hinge helix DNA binding protein